MTERKEKINNFLKEINEVCKKHNFGLLNTSTNSIILVEGKEDGTYHIAPPAVYIETEFNEKNLEMKIRQNIDMRYKPLRSTEIQLIKYRSFLKELNYDITYDDYDKLIPETNENLKFFHIKKENIIDAYYTRDELIKFGEQIKKSYMEKINESIEYLRNLGYKTDFSDNLKIYIDDGKGIVYKSIPKFLKYIEEMKSKEVKNGFK